MDFVFAVAFLLGFFATAIYLYSLYRFYALVKLERPDWVERKGSLSFFYTGMPRIADPNVGMAVLGLVFSSRIDQLQSLTAVSYARRIRVLLPMGLALFAVALAAAFIGAP
ncbi:hypothetical protein [Novilysobacter erysipheiresistens]|uniref:Uncharacterized protein n=1 Tax=Novilysobacter erysipheiresistens TaxID=1749332 RepID=A0ABU7Z2L6_9GAMM